MKVNIYYGGRGLLDDPTLYVIGKMEEVLKELRVSVERYNIYEHKNSISTLPQTLKDADGIILATTVEWLGIGGYMRSFWIPAGFTETRKRLRQPICSQSLCQPRMETVKGELTLSNAWEILGGLPCSGMCG